MMPGNYTFTYKSTLCGFKNNLHVHVCAYKVNFLSYKYNQNAWSGFIHFNVPTLQSKGESSPLVLDKV